MREELISKRNIEYFNQDSLRTLTGLYYADWDRAFIKELLDNSLDALDVAHSEGKIQDKVIKICVDDKGLSVSDNAGGIPESVLDNVYNFDVYTSSKRDYRTPTRGAQGNALKTIIGLSYIRKHELSFFTRGKQITYKVNEPKLKAGILEFQKDVIGGSSDSVAVLGYTPTFSVKALIRQYYVCNPDVTFILNDETFPAVQEPINKSEYTFIHWYKFNDFNELLQKTHFKDNQRTIKDFCKTFSGTQRILSELKFPYKKLSEIVDREDLIFDLYGQLGELTKQPSDQIFKNSLIGEDTFLSLYGNSGEHKYRQVFGHYQNENAVIPYAIEGFLLSTQAEGEPAIMSASINHTVPYKFPFNFHSSVVFMKQSYSSSGGLTLKDILNGLGFNYASGVELYIHVISPFFEFRDKAKTEINADYFGTDLLKVVEYLTASVIKEVQRARRDKKRYDRDKVFHKEKKTPKIELMRQYFQQAFQIAKGQYSIVNPRQIFYKIRELINREHDINLTPIDYKTFTQKILTAIFIEYPEIEDQVFFEPRGSFIDPFLNQQLPLGTKEVQNFINKKVKNRIYDRVERVYDLPVELQYKQVLFIEKAGFNNLFRESGLIDELNLGVISTQGFSNRASKTLMQYLIEHGIKIYLLHDCDIAGYLIAEKIMQGSDTFRESIPVEDIGLKVDDIQSLGLFPESVTYKTDYSKCLIMLTPDEYTFFRLADKRFRRVELNALTNDEIVKFVKEHIKPIPTNQETDELDRYIEFDYKDIIKEFLYRSLNESDKEALFEQVQIEKANIFNELVEDKSSVHWTTKLERICGHTKEAKIKEMLDVNST